MNTTGSGNHHHRLLSKIATNDEHGENSLYFHGWKAYDDNPFHLTQNPNGVIQMGLAENQVYIYIYITYFSVSLDALVLGLLSIL